MRSMPGVVLGPLRASGAGFLPGVPQGRATTETAASVSGGVRTPRSLVPCKDFRPLVGAALAAGWRMTRLANSHIRLFAPDGVTVVTMSATPRNPSREVRNVRAALRRAGCEV